jgi:hypothetical protein
VTTATRTVNRRDLAILAAREASAPEDTGYRTVIVACLTCAQRFPEAAYRIGDLVTLYKEVDGTEPLQLLLPGPAVQFLHPGTREAAFKALGDLIGSGVILVHLDLYELCQPYAEALGATSADEEAQLELLAPASAGAISAVCAPDGWPLATVVEVLFPDGRVDTVISLPGA